MRRARSSAQPTYGCRTVLQIVDTSISVRVQSLSRAQFASTQPWCCRAHLKRAHCAARFGQHGSSQHLPSTSGQRIDRARRRQARSAQGQCENRRRASAHVQLAVNGGTRPVRRADGARARGARAAPPPPPPPRRNGGRRLALERCRALDSAVGAAELACGCVDAAKRDDASMQQALMELLGFGDKALD